MTGKVWLEPKYLTLEQYDKKKLYQKFNPNHQPAGSSEGGEFAPAGSGSGGSGGSEPSPSPGPSAPKLSSSERQSLQDWTDGEQDDYRRSSEFGSLLDKMPTYDGTIYRGMGLTQAQIDKFKVGGNFVAKMHSSASTGIGAASDFVGEIGDYKPVILKLHQKSGADIRAFGQAGEGEVVIKRFSRYKINSIERGVSVGSLLPKSVTLITMTEES